ncbi:MAG: hypothetical protein E7601_06550 [Ruminococcaceae bacterium]|nr:hypothetical protein [Oscillospiraceae bacterium]
MPIYSYMICRPKGKIHMKKKILICAVIIALLSVAAYGTSAFFSHTQKATNVITTGNVKIELQEISASNANGGATPLEGEISVLPGAEITKTVKVKNVGSNSAWIRLSVDTAFLLADGVSGTPDTSLIKFDLNTKNWTEKDGYYYYNTSLEPGETTEPLFTHVSFAPSMDNTYQNSKALIDITAYATQKAHNGSSVFEAAGWPAAD